MSQIKNRAQICLNTIESIISSKSVDQYLIGWTSLPCGTKADQYRRHGFEHLVVLSDKLNHKTALDLEEYLQRSTMLLNDPENILCNKYHAEKKARGRTYRSDGGTLKDKLDKQFSVYIVWWGKSE
ncbi:hypothetical protein [Asticcacaulis sp. EMRT-3]|uniref:hypothetical protein n=1 Tax=Asticcacaulis sp. EMRT-3 TaxID=3040349 RepID=UPI0024AF4C28|nr:hypothetical protein [Asticcacaulis sp. EMRT-3]MDI7775314.1 hypothetical protein [Asticcacaulis sp. EMRT-3]